jgi:hypothetical protein
MTESKKHAGGRKRTGQLIWRASGSYARFWTVVDGEEIRVSRPLETTNKAVARRKLARLLAAEAPTTELAKREETVSEFAEPWLDGSKAKGLRSHDYERRHCDRIWKPEIGPMMLGAVKTQHIRDVLEAVARGKVSGMRSDRYSRATLVHIRDTALRIFESAWRDEIIAENPVKRVTLPDVDDGRIEKARCILTMMRGAEWGDAPLLPRPMSYLTAGTTPSVLIKVFGGARFIEGGTAFRGALSRRIHRARRASREAFTKGTVGALDLARHSRRARTEQLNVALNRGDERVARYSSPRSEGKVIARVDHVHAGSGAGLPRRVQLAAGAVEGKVQGPRVAPVGWPDRAEMRSVVRRQTDTGDRHIAGKYLRRSIRVEDHVPGSVVRLGLRGVAKVRRRVQSAALHLKVDLVVRPYLDTGRVVRKRPARALLSRDILPGQASVLRPQSRRVVGDAGGLGCSLRADIEVSVLLILSDVPEDQTLVLIPR